MTLLEAVSTCLSKYATFSGRARRSEYWMSGLAFFLGLMCWGILIAITGWDFLSYAAFIFALACIVPLLAVQVRRLHDVGRSGWWLFIRAIPLVGDIVIFVFSVTDGQPYANQYGPPPKPVSYFNQPGMVPFSQSPEPVDEADLPFYQARRKAALEASGKGRYESGEPRLDSQKMDDYFAYTSGEKPSSAPNPKRALSLSSLSRKTINIAAGGSILVVLLVGIFLGQNSWRSSTQGSVTAAGSGGQQAVPDPSPYTPPTSTPSPPQATQAAEAGAAAAPVPAPQQPTQTQAQLAAPPTQASALPPGDLGLTSPLRPVNCTGQYIVVYHSSTDPTVYAQDIQTNLQSHPGSKYLLTLSSCSSLNRMSKAGTLIYTVYGGPFDTLAQACVAASRFPDESYVKIMDGATSPDQAIRPCQ